MHTPRLYDLWKRVFKAREVRMNSWVISHSWLYIKIISMLLNLDWRIVLDGKLTRSRLREDYTISVHTPWTYDLWKRVFTAREVGMNSCVISHSWLHIKIIDRLLSLHCLLSRISTICVLAFSANLSWSNDSEIVSWIHSSECSNLFPKSEAFANEIVLWICSSEFMLVLRFEYGISER